MDTLGSDTPGKDLRRALRWDCGESELEQGINYNEIHSYIYKYNLTYLPTFFVNPTRESKDQYGMA